MTLWLLVAPALADIAPPEIGGVQIYPWDEAAGNVAAPGPLELTRLRAAVDLYPTWVRTDATWTVRAAPGDYVAAIPREGRDVALLPFERFDLTVDGVAVKPEDRVIRYPVGEWTVVELWSTFPLSVPADGDADVHIAAEQLASADWFTFGGGSVAVGWRAGAGGVPELDGVVRYHGLTPQDFEAFGATAVTADEVAWTGASTRAGFFVRQPRELRLLSRLERSAPYAGTEAERLRDWLVRFVYDAEPHDPEAWIVLIEALKEAADDEDIGRDASLALHDLQTRAAVVCGADDGLYERTFAWLAPPARVEGTGVLGSKALRQAWTDEAEASLLEAFRLHDERVFRKKAWAAGSVALGAAALLAAGLVRRGRARAS